MNKKILFIGIVVGIVAVLSVSGLGYVYMSGMMVAPDNDYYSSELEEETQPEEEEPEAPKTENQGPIISSIGASKTSGESPLSVEFTSTTHDPDGYIIRYWWDIEGDVFSNSQNPTHTFTEPGSFVITFTVMDDYGDIAEDTISIKVLPSTEISLNPVEDSYIELGEPDLNHGNDGSLYVTYKSGLYYQIERVSFLKFDISQIEPTVTIKKAVLKLYVDYISTPGTITVHRCSDNSWSENTITWNNAPSYTTDSEDNQYTNSDNKWLEWDVTEYLSDTISLNRKISFILNIGSNEGSLNFDSKDYSLGKKPVLEIDWE